MEFLTDYTTVIANRTYYNTPLNYKEEDNRFIIATVTPYGTYVCHLIKTDEENMTKFAAIKSKCNLPIKFTDRRVVSHDFGNTATWADPAVSVFTYQPPADQKFMLMNMRVRFPANIAFTVDNAIQFKLNLYVPYYQTVMPVLNFEYDSVSKMMRQSDDPISIPSDVIPNLGLNKIVEVNFRYSILSELYLSPITLRGSLGENIQMSTKANLPVLDVNSQPLTDDTWVLLAGRLAPDF